jgi:hypothetical protein
MQLITHSSHLDALPASPLKTHIQKRFDQLSEDTDVPPNIVLIEDTDKIDGPDYAFISESQGLVADLWDEHVPGHPDFVRPYEWVSHLPSLHLYEALLLINGEDGYWILIPESVVESHADLKWVLAESQGGLSDPQPL